MTPPGDETWMRRAIALARANLGLTGDNPSVGCVIVRDGMAIGEAATAPGGRPHAEEQALDQAGEAARGAAAYVTLEPCGERSAGHASCGERLASAGVARVFAACADPSAFASGRGVERLRAAGVHYNLGLLQAEAAPLYVDYQPHSRAPPER
ncbi:bifunctional diaminohydroxyphosphoribosylaminopyrimidine deaminase/5-amino-6-(5-phosphoribosylamino)uracil reductase RibD [Phenylobacterium sp.]|uniref:bifunctional diaminohydroxyphosphoribosylaminopyrimidine deaminase/5-amino-6-(5-phosphoribosylamino)uracil reductase RibD n=1 Tax=Phenylobacterium sp. TaxID=1871053 RepID=UPI003563E873